MALEKINVGVHTVGRSRTHRAARHTGRRLGRSGIEHGVVLDVVRQVLTAVQTLFQTGVGNVAGYDDGTVERYAGSYRIFGEFLANLRHGLGEVDAYGVTLAGLAQRFRNQTAGVVIHLLNPDTVAINLTLDVAVGRAAYAQTYRAGSAVTRQADDAHVVCKILTAELGTQTDVVGLFKQLLFQLNVAEGATGFVAGGRQVVVVVS